MIPAKQSFTNILDFRRQENSFMWVSRQLNPTVPYKQTVKLTPKELKLQVLRSPKIQELIEKLSLIKNVPRRNLEKQTEEILDEIGFNKRLPVIRWLGLALTKICLAVCPGILINEHALLNLKTLMGSTPVVYVPSHRSYADFILMSYICFTYNIEIPAIAAGMDFHAMWGMGSVLRDTGAFFMRRSFNDDNLYWDTFKEYVNVIIAKGEQGMEFFIEGTRSRTGKSLTPKIGLLSMTLKSYFNAEVPDIAFVPINISYDRVLEEKLFAFELLGVPKPKESTSGFFKSLSIVNENYGNIYINIAKPLSAKEFFANKIERSSRGIKPRHLQDNTETEKEILLDFAHEIVRTQQTHSVVTTFNILAVVLMNNLLLEKSPLKLNEMEREIIWFRSILEIFGARVDSDDIRKSLREALDVHKNLLRLDGDHIELVHERIILDKYNKTKLKAHALSENTMTLAVPYVMLQIYVNPIIHYLNDVAFLTLILLHFNSVKKDDLRNRFHFLRTIFVKEFAFCQNWEQTDYEKALATMVQFELLRETQECFVSGNNKRFQELLCGLLEPFLLSHYVLVNVLCEISSSQCDEKTVLIMCQTKLESVMNISNGVFIHPYSLSLDSLSNCLQSLLGLKILNRSKNGTGLIYDINRKELNPLISTIKQYISVQARENIEGTVTIKNKL